jgi:NTE family protein
MTNHGEIPVKEWTKANRLFAMLLDLGALCSMMFFFTACAHYAVVDKPLTRWTPEHNRIVEKLVTGDRSSEMLVLVAFSGGGTRAASFAYGVLQELAATEVMTAEGPRSMLKEIDMLSSVSGGSFTSAYYTLYGDRIFENFEERFLRKNVEGQLLWRIFRPINLIKLASSAYGKADLAAEYYDKILFNGATFADIMRPDAPALIINATDLATGQRMGFTPVFFDALCMDLQQFPVARAVTASSAVPGLFSPITLENYAGTCGYEPPAWIEKALNDKTSTIRKQTAQDISTYLDKKERPWLFLVDGGVADNLGLRSFYELFEITGDLEKTLKYIGHGDVKQILIISVDSHIKVRPPWALQRVNPSLFEILGSVSATQIGRYSRDTLEIVRDAFYKWSDELNAAGHQVTFHLVEVNFADVQNKENRAKLNEIGTNFNLTNDQVDLLISSARQVLRQSPAFQDFLAENRRLESGAADRKVQAGKP